MASVPQIHQFFLLQNFSIEELMYNGNLVAMSFDEIATTHTYYHLAIQ